MSHDLMGYIRPDAPSIPCPPYTGEWYEDRVPDTLDIAEMARLCINCLTGATDSNVDHGMYFWVVSFPPVMQHSAFDICQPKFMEGLPLLRVATGSDQNIRVDQVWMDHIVRSIGPDGLYHLPVKGWPWVWTPLWNAVLCKADGTTASMEGPAPGHFTYGLVVGRTINVLTIYYLRDRNPAWKEMIERMIGGLARLSVDRGDYCYLPSWAFEPNAKVPTDATMPVGFDALDCVGRLPEPLGKYYRISGYEPARALAEKITRFMRYHSQFYDPQGRTVGVTADNYAEDGRGHFHAHTIGLLSMLEYATAANDRETVGYVKKAYEWYRTQGSSLIGFFPENVTPDFSYPTCETCEVADMIALGLKLTEAGAGDYWDDVDRWTRNEFAELQLKDLSWLRPASGGLRPSEAAGQEDATQRVMERNLGGFTGWGEPNEWVAKAEGQNRQDAWLFMHCCTGNAARTLYYIWEHILDMRDGRLRVNLLMNRASKWADIYSHIPYEGRVDIKLKQACQRLQIRMPEWIADAETRVVCQVNGVARPFAWAGRHVDVGEVAAGDVITVTFPIAERQATETIGGREYTFGLKGNTVMWVNPPGRVCLIYRREHYQQQSAPWRAVKRFVSNQQLEW